MTARWLLHRIDAQNARGLYVRATDAALRDAAFLDGRSRFWDAEAVRDLPAKPHPAPPLRYIFHGAFCGSSLLARMLDWPGAVLSLREPQAYVDVANNGNAGARLLPHLTAAMADMAASGEAVLVKPTNWANNLIPRLSAPAFCESAVFVSQPLPDFLLAVLRGGRDRLAFAARVSAHLSAATGTGAAALARAGEDAEDGIEHVLRMAAVLHHVQETLFAEAMAARQWGASHRIAYRDLAAEPAAVALSAAHALALPLTEADMADSVARHAARHAKDAAHTFSADAQRAADDAVIAHYGAMLDRVAEWAGSL